MNASVTMKRRLRPAAINTKLVVILVILVVIAGVVTIVRWGGDEYDEAVAEHLEQDLRLWCPECQEEFTMSRIEARKLPEQVGQDGEKLVQCPKCVKFVANWGGQARAGQKREGDAQVVQP